MWQAGCGCAVQAGCRMHGVQFLRNSILGHLLLLVLLLVLALILVVQCHWQMDLECVTRVWWCTFSKD